ncbi:hypothetical protein FACS1894122_14120 [Alphaproteobacteria bacterium]|nr:hypothetical protein FACS1894122_14120 [Alphaproteobacteria bacterium]
MLNNRLLTQVSQFYGFENIEFVNKDFYVVEVLKILLGIKSDFCDFIFSGGTCMAKAYNLIERMSEDVDIKVRLKNETVSAGILRKKLSLIKHQVLEELQKRFPDFKEENIKADHGNCHIVFEITYPKASETFVLRNRIKLELTQCSVKLSPIVKSVSSLVTLAQNNAPDIPNIMCIDPVETIAEKMVALVRRVCAFMETGERLFDPSIIRHVYDIFVIYPKINPDGLLPLVKEIVGHDAIEYRSWHPQWSGNPVANTKIALAELKTDRYSDLFEKYTHEMIYAKQVPQYTNAIRTVSMFIEEVFASITP